MRKAFLALAMLIAGTIPLRAECTTEEQFRAKMVELGASVNLIRVHENSFFLAVTSNKAGVVVAEKDGCILPGAIVLSPPVVARVLRTLELS